VFSRSSVALALTITLVGPAGARGAPSSPRPSMAQAIAQVVDRPQLRHSLFGIEVYDLDAKRPLFSLNGDKFFEPASTTKVLTAGTSLALLGPGFTFTTPVYRTGQIGPDGTLSGDLVLVASGDPNLSQRIQPNGSLAFENEDHSYDGSRDTKAVPGDPLAVLRDLARQIAVQGVKRVTGRVLVDASLFPEKALEDDAYLSPIIVNDNQIDVTVTPGAHAGDAATIAVSPQTPYAVFTGHATTGEPKSANTIDFEDRTDEKANEIVSVVGSIPADDSPTLYAYRFASPARLAEVGLTLALQQAGVQIAEAPRDVAFDRNAYAASYVPANVVAQHVSPPLSEEVKVTLKVSDNLHAAAMPYLWGVYAAGATSRPLRAGFERERSLLSGAGLDLAGAVQSDGMGKAFFTPDFIVHYLAWARAQPWYGAFYRGLPVLGVDGTLYNVGAALAARGRVHAKTGTLGSSDLLNRGNITTSKGLVGYVTSRGGRRLAFCIYLNRLTSRNGEDVGVVAGEVTAEIANAIYLYAP
jgi:PBP4 family serine-type D-alanyl-D-alanine carboxypeptidase